MNTSVNIGSSQDFRLSRALLVYGKSSYNGFPYRHPFVTLHEVIHDSQGARLAEGQLVTPDLLIDLMVSLGKSVPAEILPERVLVRTTETIVWWMPAGERTMFFSDRGGDAALQRMNAKRYPHPPLVFKASGTHLWIRALARSERPDLAIMDVKMPRLDGIEAAKRILDERPIPIVMLTAYGQEELVNRAVEAGVFGYLVKPFREQDLVPAIATARARHEELTAVREEAESLADALAARKAIERAKGLLMEKEGLSEPDAFARLRRASQVSGRPLQVIAEAVIATLDPS